MPFEQGQVPKQTYNTIYLVGPRLTLPFPADQVPEGVLVIGDGQNPLGFDKVSSALNENKTAIDDYPRVIINAHGNVIDGRHRIELIEGRTEQTADIVTHLSCFFAKPIDVTVASCFGGTAAQDREALEYGGSITTIGFHDEVAWNSMHDYTTTQALKGSIPQRENFKLDNPYARFAYTILTNPALYCSFSPHIEGAETFKFRPLASGDFTSRDTLMQYQRYQLAQFGQYCRCLQESGTLPEAEQQHVAGLLQFLQEEHYLDGAAPPIVYQPSAWTQELQGPCVEQAIELYYRIYHDCLGNTRAAEAVRQLNHLSLENVHHVNTIVRALQQHNVYPTKYDPIFLAVENNDVNWLHKLIDAGASIVVTNHKGKSPLHTAVHGSNSEAVKLLLEAGAPIEAADVKGNKPLHIAAALGNVASIQMLLKHGANINAVDDTGATPLHIAGLMGNSEAVKLLLEEGASSTMKDLGGSTAFDYAKIKGQGDAVKVFKRHEAHKEVKQGSKAPIENAIEARNQEAVSTLLDKLAENVGTDISKAKPKDVKALVEAAEQVQKAGMQLTPPIAKLVETFGVVEQTRIKLTSAKREAEDLPDMTSQKSKRAR